MTSRRFFLQFKISFDVSHRLWNDLYSSLPLVLPHCNLLKSLRFTICEALHVPISKAILMAFVASQVQAGVACMLCPCIWDAYPMPFLMKFILGYHHTLSVSLATFYTPTLRVSISCGQRKRKQCYSNIGYSYDYIKVHS